MTIKQPSLPLAMPAETPFDYTTNNGTITITRHRGAVGAVTIPSAVNGLPVASIGSSAFKYCTNLTSVTIPDGVRSIGVGAFWEKHPVAVSTCAPKAENRNCSPPAEAQNSGR